MTSIYIISSFPGNLRLAVILPEGEDPNEWIAVNTVDFFNQINMLYGTITEFCTEETCPIMSAGETVKCVVLLKRHWISISHHYNSMLHCNELRERTTGTNTR